MNASQIRNEWFGLLDYANVLLLKKKEKKTSGEKGKRFTIKYKKMFISIDYKKYENIK